MTDSNRLALLIENVLMGPHELMHGLTGVLLGDDQEYDPTFPGWRPNYRIDEADPKRQMIIALAPLLLFLPGILMAVLADSTAIRVIGAFLIYNAIPSINDVTMAIAARDFGLYEHEEIPCENCDSTEALIAKDSCFCPDCESLWIESEHESFREALFAD